MILSFTACGSVGTFEKNVLDVSDSYGEKITIDKYESFKLKDNPYIKDKDILDDDELNSTVILFWYTVDVSDDTQNDNTASDWNAYFEAYQETKDNLKKLDMASYTDDKFDENSEDIIKPGKSGKGCFGYYLRDAKLPVILIAADPNGGDEIGRQEYKINGKK